jgi:uncharacterized protein YacL
MPEKIFRTIYILLFAVLGVVLGAQLDRVITQFMPASFLTETILGITFVSLGIMLVGAILGGIVGYFLAPYLNHLLFTLTGRIETSLASISTQDLLLGTLGLFFGLIIANLVGLAFVNVPFIGPYISIVLSILLGYLGMHLAISKEQELTEWLRAMRKGGRAARDEEEQTFTEVRDKLLDTSVIIDGRVADIRKTGFLEGELLVPVFVLEELQKIADSADLLKRNRGRRGLDILNQMRKSHKNNIRIITDDFEEVNEVDSKLMRLALQKGYQIITNDYNMNKVAELQGISVLNINDLANAVKPAVIPGEQLFVQLVKNGKEEGQGIAYLDDGTMIVVENGSKSIGKEVLVVITSVLQTSAGRMIFAELKDMDE